MKTIIMAIKPQYAEAILNGTKKWEFRKRIPKEALNSRVLIYCTSPIKKIIGEFVIRGVYVFNNENDLIRNEITEQDCGLSYSELINYAKGEQFYGLHVGQTTIIRYDYPISLDHFGIHYTPQSWVYLPNV